MALEVPLALNLRSRVDSEVRGQALTSAELIAATAASLVDPPRPAPLARLVRTAARNVRGRVIVVDAAGRLLADSAGRAPGLDYATRPEIERALAGETEQERRHSRTLDADILATAVPVLGPRRTTGAVRVTQSVEAVGAATRRAVLGIVAVGAVVLVLGLLAGALLAARLSRPVRRLDEAARRMADGDFSVRVTPAGAAEHEALAEAFNEMTERIAGLLEAQKAFVADASHQLRTPLTGLRLRLEGARAAVDGDEARDLDAALAEVDRLSGIVDELLALSEAAAEPPAPGESLQLVPLVLRVASRWEAEAARRGQRVLAAAGEDGVQVRCSAADLERILDVLIENALRYSPEHTTVTVRSQGTVVSVLDEGPGLAPGEHEAVFERFRRGSAGRAGPRGSGLGLAIARQLAARWGASVRLRDRDGRGACAEVSLRPAR